MVAHNVVVRGVADNERSVMAAITCTLAAVNTLCVPRNIG